MVGALRQPHQRAAEQSGDRNTGGRPNARRSRKSCGMTSFICSGREPWSPDSRIVSVLIGLLPAALFLLAAFADVWP